MSISNVSNISPLFTGNHICRDTIFGDDVTKSNNKTTFLLIFKGDLCNAML